MASENEIHDNSDEQETPYHKLVTEISESIGPGNQRTGLLYERLVDRINRLEDRIDSGPCDLVDVPDDEGNTPLMLSLKFLICHNIRYNEIEYVIDSLLEKGADIHKANNEGFTAAMLFIADVTNTDMHQVKELLDEKPNQETSSINIKYKPVDILEQVIIQTRNYRWRMFYNHWVFTFVSKLGLDLNERNEQGLTPLLIAVDHLQFRATEYFLRLSNADSCVKYPEGESLLSRLMTRFLGDDSYCDRDYEKDELLYVVVQLINCPAFKWTEQCAVDASPIVDLLRTGGLVEQVIKEKPRSYFLNGGSVLVSILDVTFVFYILEQIQLDWHGIPNECATRLARYLLSIVLKPNRADQFLMSMVSGSKTLVEVFVKTGALPVFNNISETVLRELLVNSWGAGRQLKYLNSDNNFSPFLLSFCLPDADMAAIFIKENFLTNRDLHPTPLLKSRIKELIKEHPAMMQIYQDFYCQPHSLFRLSFVQVSMCVGFDSDRKERVSLTGLYPTLQRSLMYSDG